MSSHSLLSGMYSSTAVCAFSDLLSIPRPQPSGVSSALVSLLSVSLPVTCGLHEKLSDAEPFLKPLRSRVLRSPSHATLSCRFMPQRRDTTSKQAREHRRLFLVTSFASAINVVARSACDRKRWHPHLSSRGIFWSPCTKHIGKSSSHIEQRWLCGPLCGWRPCAAPKARRAWSRAGQRRFVTHALTPRVSRH